MLLRRALEHEEKRGQEFGLDPLGHGARLFGYPTLATVDLSTSLARGALTLVQRSDVGS